MNSRLTNTRTLQRHNMEVTFLMFLQCCLLWLTTDGIYFLPVTLMGTISVRTAWACCLIFSSGVGRGGALDPDICPSTSTPSTSPWLCALIWQVSFSSSPEDAVDWKRGESTVSFITEEKNKERELSEGKNQWGVKTLFTQCDSEMGTPLAAELQVDHLKFQSGPPSASLTNQL